MWGMGMPWLQEEGAGHRDAVTAGYGAGHRDALSTKTVVVPSP
jgi:hypothetical protein